MDIEDEFFETKDFYLACFLKARDRKLLKATKEGKLATFYFENKDDLKELIANFYNDSEMVSANRLINAIRDLKSLVHNIK